MSNIEVILPDNSKISLQDGANGFDLAKTHNCVPSDIEGEKVVISGYEQFGNADKLILK